MAQGANCFFADVMNPILYNNNNIMIYHISQYDLSHIKIVMMSFTFSTNKISGIWPTPNPEKSKSEFQPIRML